MPTPVEAYRHRTAMYHKCPRLAAVALSSITKKAPLEGRLTLPCDNIQKARRGLFGGKRRTDEAHGARIGIKAIARSHLPLATGADATSRPRNRTLIARSHSCRRDLIDGRQIKPGKPGASPLVGFHDPCGRNNHWASRSTYACGRLPSATTRYRPTCRWGDGTP